MASPLRRAKGTEVELTEFSLGPCLGMGAFATVHAAVRKQTGERVAIKISRKAIVGSAEADSTQEAAFFRAEVALMSSKGVGHPNIVRCFGHGTMPCEGGAAGFLVMEMLPGKDLRARLRAPIDLSDVETWSMQLALALAHLHAHGIVHRDVKTSNLMLDHLSELKLVDFGLATTLKEIERGAGSTQQVGSCMPFLHCAASHATRPILHPSLVRLCPGGLHGLHGARDVSRARVLSGRRRLCIGRGASLAAPARSAAPARLAVARLPAPPSI